MKTFKGRHFMNITSFIIYCIVVTFTPGPTNIVILSTVHNFGTKRAMEYTYGATVAFGLLLSISTVLNTIFVMLFNPEQAHDGMAHDESGLDYVMLYIEPQLLLEVIEKKDMVRFTTPIVYDNRLEQRVLSLSNAILNKKDEALCSELLLSLTDSLIQTNLSINNKKDNVLIRKAKDLLHTNLENVLKLDEISKELNLSKFQFIRLFKTQIGISPYQYFLNCKVELAKQLIEKNKDVYSAVAQCGFVDLTHLNKYFKRTYGITAFEYMSYLN